MILSAGEALIDMLPRETRDGGQAFQPHAGGAVFNTAIALGRLGVPSGFLSGISTDLFGELLIETLGASQVDAGLAVRSDRPTTLAFVTLVDGQASYAFYDENTAGRMLSEADLPMLGDDVEAVFFGGISLAVEPCASAYQALMAREAAARVTMIDPNIRPGFIRDETAYRARIMDMIGRADIVKLSDEDLAWLMGDREATDLLEWGPAIVLVTEGSRGAAAFFGSERIWVDALRAEVVDTVGAGDTFNAGILASLHDQGLLDKAALRAIAPEALTAAMMLGAQAAAVTVSRAGANPPTRDEL